MSVDVTAETVIARGRDVVAGYVIDPSHDTEWIGGIKEARDLTGGGTVVGSHVARVASFLGRRIEYINEVVELEPGSRLVMQSVKAPFPMRITYSFTDAPGGTRASVRVQGEPGRYYGPVAPLLSFFVKQSISRDMRNLKRVLESRPAPAEGSP